MCMLDNVVEFFLYLAQKVEAKRFIRDLGDECAGCGNRWNREDGKYRTEDLLLHQRVAESDAGDDGWLYEEGTGI